MRRILLSIIMLASIGLFAQQIDRVNVLLEAGTGTGCGYCPGVAMAFEDFYANGDPVACIKYHSYNGSDPFNTPEAAARTSYYGITGYPHTQFDGEWSEYGGGNATQSLYTTFLPIVNSRMTIPTSFEIEIFGSNVGDLYTITIKSKKVFDYSGNNLKIRFALTESNIPYNWQNQTEINFTERLMAPDANGVTVEYPNIGQEIETELTFTFDNSWVKENCELVAWIQNDGNKFVPHSTSVMMDDLVTPEPTFVAGFYAEPTELCTAGTAHFHEDCIGEPETYHWSFPGGYPAESWDADPNVYYAEIGTYEVELIIINGLERDTAFKDKYITVHELPEVSFNAVENLCNEDWDPYELTQGEPAGGVYEGPFVTDNVLFHPTEAGVGDYDLVYNYTDEFGCSNSDNQTVHVVNCVGIGETTENIALEVYPNPTLGKFNINISSDLFNTATIKVVDAMGKVVIEKKQIEINTTYSSSIDISSHPQGVYFVIVSNNNKQVVQKLFLQK